MIRIHLNQIHPEDRAHLRSLAGEDGWVALDAKSPEYTQHRQRQVDRRRKNPDPRGGVGTEIRQLLQAKGITDKDSCSCRAMAAKWDRLGIPWCEGHQPNLVAHLNKQAKARGWLMALKAKVGAGLLVKQAIENAKARASREAS